MSQKNRLIGDKVMLSSDAETARGNKSESVIGACSGYRQASTVVCEHYWFTITPGFAIIKEAREKGLRWISVELKSAARL